MNRASPALPPLEWMPPEALDLAAPAPSECREIRVEGKGVGGLVHIGGCPRRNLLLGALGRAREPLRARLSGLTIPVAIAVVTDAAAQLSAADLDAAVEACAGLAPIELDFGEAGE